MSLSRAVLHGLRRHQEGNLKRDRDLLEIHALMRFHSDGAPGVYGTGLAAGS